MSGTRIITLPFLLLGLSPFVIFDSDYVPPTLPPMAGGGWGHIVFGTDPVGVSIGVKLLVRSVT